MVTQEGRTVRKNKLASVEANLSKRMHVNKKARDFQLHMWSASLLICLVSKLLGADSASKLYKV